MSDKKKNLKHKYHLVGIGGKPSKQMKELQNKPLPMILFKIDNPKPPDEYYSNKAKSIMEIMNNINKLLDKEITRLTDKKCKNPISPNPSKNA